MDRNGRPFCINSFQLYFRDKGLERFAPQRPLSIDHLVQLRLETHAFPRPKQFPPVARLRSRRQIAVPKRPRTIFSNHLRDLRILDQVAHFLIQVREIAFDDNNVLIRTRWDEKVSMRFDPIQLVGDGHGSAVEEVLRTARIGVAFGVDEILVLTMLRHGQEILMSGPVDCLDITPALPLGHMHQSPTKRICDRGTSPDGKRLLVAPGGLGISYLSSDFAVLTHIIIRPTPIAKIGHDPLLFLLTKFGEDPDGVYIFWSGSDITQAD